VRKKKKLLGESKCMQRKQKRKAAARGSSSKCENGSFLKRAAIAISALVPIQVSLFVLWHLRVKTECSKLDIEP